MHLEVCVRHSMRKLGRLVGIKPTFLGISISPYVQLDLFDNAVINM